MWRYRLGIFDEGKWPGFSFQVEMCLKKLIMIDLFEEKKYDRFF